MSAETALRKLQSAQSHLKEPLTANGLIPLKLWKDLEDWNAKEMDEIRQPGDNQLTTRHINYSYLSHIMYIICVVYIT